MSTPDPAMSPARARRVVNSGKVRHRELNQYGINGELFVNMYTTMLYMFTKCLFQCDR